MEQEFTAYKEICDNYEEQIKYYELNSKSTSLLFSDKLVDLYRLLIQAGSSVEKEHYVGSQSFPKVLQQIFDMEQRVESSLVSEGYQYLSKFIYDLLNSYRWQDVLVGLQAFKLLYQHNLSTLNVEQMTAIIVDTYCNHLNNEMLANQVIQTLTQIINHLTQQQLDYLFQSSCSRLLQINVEDSESSSQLMTILSLINQNCEIKILRQHNNPIRHKYPSQKIHLHFYKTLKMISGDKTNNDELDQLLLQGIQHSDVRVRQISQVIACKQINNKSNFLWQNVIAFLQITLFDQVVEVRKESTQIVKDVFPLLENEEKKAFQQELFSLLFFNQQVEQLKQDSNLCCQLLAENQQKLYIENSLVKIVNLSVLQCSSEQLWEKKAAVHTIGRLLMFMKGNDKIQQLSNDICEVLLMMNDSEEIAFFALRSLQPLLDSFTNILLDDKYLKGAIDMVFFSIYKSQDEKQKQVPINLLQSVLNQRGENTFLEYFNIKLENSSEKGKLIEKLGIIFSVLIKRKQFPDLQLQILITIVKVIQGLMVDKANQESIFSIYVCLEEGIRGFQTKDIQQKDALKRMIEESALNETLQKDIKIGQVLLKALEDQLGKQYMLQKFKHIY